MPSRLERLLAPFFILFGALFLRLLAGVGFANYDTLYALLWGQQLSGGHLPQYAIPVAPTPHPLLEALGFILSPLGPRLMEDVVVALGFLSLSACAWVLYRLGSEWFGRASGALAALLLLTRLPILSYGVRAYVDLPYLLLVLSALLFATRRPRGEGAIPVLSLLALAGLLRPEAWAFSGLYFLYLLFGRHAAPARLAWLLPLALAAPLLWTLSDFLITGDALWSLTNTRHTASALLRVTGLTNVPEYIPRRLGEILRPPVLFGAALGGVLTLLWLRTRALLPALAGLLAVFVFALFAGAGLPINTRYAFLAAAILCLFCGASVFGWTQLPARDSRRRPWMLLGLLVGLSLLAYAPAQFRSVHRELSSLSRQQRIQDDLLALVDAHVVSLRCGPLGVPNHRPIPLLALRLDASPARVLSAQVTTLTHGTYIDPATPSVERSFTLDPHDPHPLVASVPFGFALVGGNRSWRLFQRC